MRHPEWFEDETKDQQQLDKEAHSNKIQKAVDAVVEFLEDNKDENNIAKVSPVSAAEGYYEGLPDVLAFAGLKPKHISIDVLNEAWKRFRQSYPAFAKTRGINPKYIDAELVKEKKKEKEEEKPAPEPKKKKRNEIFGFNVSSVIRRMANEGFDENDVRKMLKHFGIEVTPTTITGQLWCGLQKNKKKYGKLAKLSEDDINYLFEVISK